MAVCLFSFRPVGRLGEWPKRQLGARFSIPSDNPFAPPNAQEVADSVLNRWAKAIEIEGLEVRLAELEAGAAAKSKLCVRVVQQMSEGI